MIKNTDILKDIQTYYGSKNTRYILKDKIFDPRGINYTNFTKIKYDSINDGLIKDLYTIDGWYLLYWLMSNSINSQYITTNIALIAEESHFSTTKIKKILKYLQDSEIIIIKSNESKSKIKSTSTLHISIIYNSAYGEEDNGYIPIPTEYIKNILPTLTPYDWALYSLLLVRYSYFTVTKSKCSQLGENPYKYQRTHYAFPTYNSIVKDLGIGKDSISQSIKNLTENKFKLMKKETLEPEYNILPNGKKVYRESGNNIYYISLLERIEYIYYCIYRIINPTQYKEYENIQNIGFEKVAVSDQQEFLKGKHWMYILNYYPHIIKAYKEYIEKNDTDAYNRYEDKTISK